MSRDPLPIAVVLVQVNRLAAAFRSRVDLGAYAGELRLATAGWSETELFEAVTGVIAREKFFPRIAGVRDARPKRAAAGEHWQPDTCTDCGRHLYYAGYELFNGEVHGKVRCDCPSDNPAWNTPNALAWRETDRNLLALGFGTPPDRADYAA